MVTKDEENGNGGTIPQTAVPHTAENISNLEVNHRQSNTDGNITYKINCIQQKQTLKNGINR